MFNTLKYALRLEERGFTREQAEAQIQMLTDVVQSELVTKQDLALAFKESELRMTIRMGAMMAAMLTVHTAILGIMFKLLTS